MLCIADSRQLTCNACHVIIRNIVMSPHGSWPYRMPGWVSTTPLEHMVCVIVSSLCWAGLGLRMQCVFGLRENVCVSSYHYLSGKGTGILR